VERDVGDQPARCIRGWICVTALDEVGDSGWRARRAQPGPIEQLLDAGPGSFFGPSGRVTCRILATSSIWSVIGARRRLCSDFAGMAGAGGDEGGERLGTGVDDLLRVEVELAASTSLRMPSKRATSTARPAAEMPGTATSTPRRSASRGGARRYREATSFQILRWIFIRPIAETVGHVFGHAIRRERIHRAAGL
jgi:hypothetical protein